MRGAGSCYTYPVPPAPSASPAPLAPLAPLAKTASLAGVSLTMFLAFAGASSTQFHSYLFDRPRIARTQLAE